MNHKNKKINKGMKFMAVLSILSMTVFSYSFTIVSAHEIEQQTIASTDHTEEYSESSHDTESESNIEDNNESHDVDFGHTEIKDGSNHDSDNNKNEGHSNDSDSKDSDKSNKKDDSENNKKSDDKNNKDHNKVTICHATHSKTNPYVEITISISGEDAHKHHQDAEDIIPAPQKGCPGEHENNNGDEHGNGDHHDNGNGDDHHNECDSDHDSDDHECDSNKAPVITLIGNSIVNIYAGDTYNDLGATAFDKEDGNITANIVKTGTVDTSIVGTYTITYNVKDSKGLCAKTVTRTIIVKPVTQVNTAPVITLLGLNPINVTQGDFYLDPGATANDLEDGDITANIVKTGSVDVSVVGTYTITYNVEDSQWLSAVPVTRTVNVIPAQTSNKGKITFCLVLADDQNVIATSSHSLPEGTFTMSLGTTTGVATTTLFTKTWDATTFAPNQKVILGQNDSDCVVYGNLDYGTYNYSEMSVNGSTWNMPKYNDQSSQPVNNVFDFFSYGPDNGNADGSVTIYDGRSDRTVYVYNTYKAGPTCDLPEITSSLAVNATIGSNFVYSLTASSTSNVSFDVATSSLPVGLSYATSTNTISGTPTVLGTYNIALKATNSCGFDEKTLKINVVDTTGGGGSHGANLSVSKTANRTTANVGEEITYTITLENKGPEAASNVKVTDVLPSFLDFESASSSVGAYATSTGIWTIGSFANGSTTALTILAKVKAGSEGQNVTNTAVASGSESDSDSSNNTSSAVVNINPAQTTGGGGGNPGGGSGSNGPIVGSYGGGSVLGTSTSSGVSALPAVQGCNYLLDYLRADFNNKPFEVLKLQLFLKNLEGFTNLPITSVYDQATIDAVNIFQMRYKDDVLTPWGHTAGTSYTYILTKKKVNEIYCKIAFPVTSDQQLEIDNYRNSHKGQTAPAKTNNAFGEVGYTGSGSNNTSSSNTSVGVVVKSDKNNQSVNVVENNDSDFGSTSQNVKETVRNGVSNVANVGLTTLAGFSSSTKGVASDFIANVISSGKKIGSLLGAIFTLPASLVNKFGQNSCQNNLSVFSGLNFILLLLVVLVSYFWYREYANNKKIEEINKEIDLK